MSFQFVRPSTAAAAAQFKGADSRAMFIAGGSGVVDLLSQNVFRPSALIDLTSLPEHGIEVKGDGGLHVGALTTMGELAWHSQVMANYPVLMQALLSGATPQVHHAATIGGNLLQKTRCPYYRNQGFACNKRNPGSGCDAVDGYNAGHAIFGGSAKCVATHPSDLAVGLLSLDATVTIQGLQGMRTIELADLHRLPGDTPQIDSHLSPDELITAVDIPPVPPQARSVYSKVDEHNSYSFAVVSVAAVVQVLQGVVSYVRLAAGGVAHKPWRLQDAEAELLGKPLNRLVIDSAAEAAIRGASPLQHNGHKVPLLQQTVAGILTQLSDDRQAGDE